MDIAEKRRGCIAKRREFQRQGRRNGDRDDLRVIYNIAKKKLRLAIRKSQERAWADLVAGVEKDVWGLPYRLVMRKLPKRPVDALTRGREVEIASHLFPRTPTTAWDEIALTGPRGFPIPDVPGVHSSPLTMAELVQAARGYPGARPPARTSFITRY